MSFAKPALAVRLAAWLLVVLLAIGIVGGLAFIKYQRISTAIATAEAMPEPSETVTEARAHPGTWSATSRAIGTVRALREVTLMAEIPGVVTEVAFASGDRVEAGQVMVKLDARQEEADLTAARAEAELAELTLNRRKRMQANVADSEIDAARAALTAARAAVARLQVAIAKKTIRAPFNARVGITDLQPGAYLEAGAFVAELRGVDEDAYVDFTLPQDQAALIQPGVMVSLRNPALAQESRAEVIAVDAAVDARGRTVRFRARAERLGDRLRPGAFVDVVAVTAPPREVLLVPLTALRRSAWGEHVFVLVEENGVLRARQRQVRAGPVVDRAIAVEEGLAEGERVAATGAFKLRDGLRVNIGTDAGEGPR
jgi:membrane fusion protein, multidrug efflux system